MARFQLTRLLEVAARGGLSQENITKHPDKAASAHTPTRAGRFTILSVEKHVSGGRWIFSTIPWGTPMRVDKDAVYINRGGTWKKLSELNPQWLEPYKKSYPRSEWELQLRKTILDYYKGMASSFGSSTPTTWVFNDFGHISVKYYRDNNNNGIFEKNKDELMSDFIHTTPPDEAATAYNTRNKLPDNISLAYSHGCIHIKPNDIDRLISLGYVRKGIIIQIHPYAAVMNVPVSFTSDIAKGPHELHFFPTKSPNMSSLDGGGKLAVYRVSKLS
jgi:hypothetical protein